MFLLVENRNFLATRQPKILDRASFLFKHGIIINISFLLNFTRNLKLQN